MKTLKIVLIALLALPVLSFAKDEPKFSGGFSSGKSTSTTKSQSTSATPKPAKKEASPAQNANAAGTGKTSFGSFGGAKAAKDATAPATPAATPAAATKSGAAPAPAKSALTQSLDKNSAQTNALKTLDARNAQKAAVGVASTAPPGPNVSPAVPMAPPPAPPPQVVYQNAPSSGWSRGIMGFLLGNSMSSNARSYNNHNNGYNQSNSGYNQPNSTATGSASDVAEVEPKGSSFLRVLAWLLILGSIGGLIWYLVKRSSANAAAAAAKRNYSL